MKSAFHLKTKNKKQKTKTKIKVGGTMRYFGPTY